MAKAPAGDEWCRRIFPKIKAAAERELGKHGVKPSQILYQYDNATHHVCPGSAERMAEMIDMDSQIVPQPKQGPDFQRIIENLHGTLTAALGRHLALHKKITSQQGYMKAAEELFYGLVTTSTGNVVCSPEGVKNEMAKMDSFYREVRGAKGDWPSTGALQ